MTDWETNYQPENHIFLQPHRTSTPKPASKGGFPPRDCHAKDISPIIDEKFDETISTTESKAIQDNMAYYVLDLRVTKEHPSVEAIVKKFNGKILSELSESELLVTSSIADLKSAKEALKYKTFRKNLFNIHCLTINDVKDPELKFESEKKILTIYLVPNLGIEKANEYLEKIRQYLTSRDIALTSIFLNKTTGDASIDVLVEENQLNDLMNNFGFIFKAHETIHVQDTHPTNQIETRAIINERLFNTTEIATLPLICLLDTGVTPISSLQRLIVERQVEPPFINRDDLDNHGTSVASLAVYGDNVDQIGYPKARIISHKIMERKKGANLTTALDNAINRYSCCKIFNCSVNYTASNLGLKLVTRNIDKLTQTSNSIVVFSAGNIEPTEIESAISNGAQYPDYINEATVTHPSDALSVLCVGAYSKFGEANSSIAPAGAPAPFTPFGTNLKELKNSPKPELAEHGGNMCICRDRLIDNGRYNCEKVGIDVFSNNGSKIKQMGTSFAAPLISLEAAELWQHFPQIKNAETIKALLLSTCEPTRMHSKYAGLGVPNRDEMFTSRHGVVRVIFEGTLPLVSTIEREIPTEELKVYIPADITSIELFLVHSDNYSLSPFPKLNTYLSMEVEKPGKGGVVDPTFGKSMPKTHVKHLIYNYDRNVKGDWFFRIIPHAIGISTAERKKVTVRYGAVIKLKTKRARSGVGESVMQGLTRGQEISFENTFGREE
jgi:hypothetical protein